MDEVINKSLNEGNVHFFVTINFEKEIKTKNKLKNKIKDLNFELEKIETISWYNIVSEKNKNKNYHLHLIIAIRSLIGFNDIIINNLKFFLIEKYEKDIKIDVCWKFIDIKKSWRYLYKDYEKEKEKKEKKKEEILNNKLELDPVFEDRLNIDLEFKKEDKKEEKKEDNKKKKDNKKEINLIKTKKEFEKWFFKISEIKEDYIKIENISENNYDFLKGIRMEEKNFNEKQLILLWEYFLLINNILIYNNKLYIKIENSMISYKEFNKIDFLYDNINSIFFFFKKEFPFQFENFDELNFIIKFMKNKNEKIERFKEFTGRRVIFNFNILEFKDGIYSIIHNKFIRTNKFDKNYEKSLKEILINKDVKTIKNYNMSFENIKEPYTWLKSIEKVLGLKKRTDSLSDKIANFFNEDDREWLLIYIAYIFHYSTNELKKKNTLYIWGPSNTGKTTLIINLFINYFGKENIGLISNNKNFEYQHIINKNLLIFDEFDINKINVENFKKLVSKELILGEKKGKEPEIIEPTPILISSNYNLENKLNMNENKEAIINRLKTINFKEKFENKEMDEEINKKIKEEEAKIIVYCNRVYFNKVKKGKKTRMDDIKLLEKI